MSYFKKVCSTGRYQPVVHNKNYNINSPKSAASGDMDKWLQAWEDNSNNNTYRAPSYHQNAQQQQRQHSKVPTNIQNYESSNSNNFNSSNRQSIVDPFDPFEDPWSGISNFLFSLCSFSIAQHAHFPLSLISIFRPFIYCFARKEKFIFVDLLI